MVRLDYRMIFVWSESKARQEATTRERHTAKVVAEFEAVQRNLGRYSLKTTEAIVRRLEAAKGKYAEGALLDYRLVQGPGRRLHSDMAVRRRGAGALAAPGRGLRAEDQPAGADPPAAEVLRTYKGQSQVERRFHHLKGPLAVAPMFLKNPERIAGLLCVLVWALMVLALMERQVRRELKGKPLYGLYPEGRPSPAPTGPLTGPGAEWPVDRHRSSGRHGRPPSSPARPDATPGHPATWDQLGTTENLQTEVRNVSI